MYLLWPHHCILFAHYFEEQDIFLKTSSLIGSISDSGLNTPRLGLALSSPLSPPLPVFLFVFLPCDSLSLPTGSPTFQSLPTL